MIETSRGLTRPRLLGAKYDLGVFPCFLKTPQLEGCLAKD